MGQALLRHGAYCLIDKILKKASCPCAAVISIKLKSSSSSIKRIKHKMHKSEYRQVKKLKARQYISQRKGKALAGALAICDWGLHID